MTRGISLRISFRRGRVLAGYLYLPRKEGDRVARSTRTDEGLVLDYTDDDRLIGIELPSPTSDALRAVLGKMKELHCDNPEQELRPLEQALAC